MDGRALTGAARRDLILAAVLCGAVGVACWGFYVAAFWRAAPVQDWLAFYNAVCLYFDGRLADLYDGVRFTALLNARFAPVLAAPMALQPWLYPPDFLVLLLPFGLVPVVPAAALFLLATFAAAVAATWTIAERGWPRWLQVGALALSPAAAITVALGQNAFLTAALLVGGFGLLPRRPVLAGALLGVATYKPQLWLMVPVALLAGRHWKSLASAVIAAAILVGLSVLVLGTEPWLDWIRFAAGASDLYDQWLAIGRLRGQSVFACIVMLGGAPGLANAVQAAASVLAAGAVWWMYRRPAPTDLRVAVLLAATVLAAPHVVAYDAVLSGVAATLLLRRALAEGGPTGDFAAALALWLSAAVPPVLFRVGVVTPLLILMVIAAVLRRAGPAAGPIAGMPLRSPSGVI